MSLFRRDSSASLKPRSAQTSAVNSLALASSMKVLAASIVLSEPAKPKSRSRMVWTMRPLTKAYEVLLGVRSIAPYWYLN